MNTIFVIYHVLAFIAAFILAFIRFIMSL